VFRLSDALTFSLPAIQDVIIYLVQVLHTGVKNDTTSTKNQRSIMDPIWQALPTDLVVLILSQPCIPCDTKLALHKDLGCLCTKLDNIPDSFKKDMADILSRRKATTIPHNMTSKYLYISRKLSNTRLVVMQVRETPYPSYYIVNTTAGKTYTYTQVYGEWTEVAWVMGVEQS
jgi:hypothetical protein